MMNRWIFLGEILAVLRRGLSAMGCRCVLGAEPVDEALDARWSSLLGGCLLQAGSPRAGIGFTGQIQGGAAVCVVHMYFGSGLEQAVDALACVGLGRHVQGGLFLVVDGLVVGSASDQAIHGRGIRDGGGVV